MKVAPAILKNRFQNIAFPESKNTGFCFPESNNCRHPRRGIQGLVRIGEREGDRRTKWVHGPDLALSRPWPRLSTGCAPSRRRPSLYVAALAGSDRSVEDAHQSHHHPLLLLPPSSLSSFNSPSSSTRATRNTCAADFPRHIA
jgi:hypothetical protein